jgi:hypothetical protein
MPSRRSGKGSPRRPSDDIIDEIVRRSSPRKRRKPKGGSAELEPVKPDRPNLLSGGAAAELEFDD